MQMEKHKLTFLDHQNRNRSLSTLFSVQTLMSSLTKSCRVNTCIWSFADTFVYMAEMLLFSSKNCIAPKRNAAYSVIPTLILIDFLKRQQHQNRNKKRIKNAKQR